MSWMHFILHQIRINRQFMHEAGRCLIDKCHNIEEGMLEAPLESGLRKSDEGTDTDLMSIYRGMKKNYFNKSYPTYFEQ